MIKYNKRTIANVLSEVDDIKDKTERITQLRLLCMVNGAIAKVIQWTYHPKIVFELPEGDVPESLWTPADHKDHGPLYRLINKGEIKNLCVGSPVKKTQKEVIFMAMLNQVSKDDAQLLIGIKNKRLPFKTLTNKFCQEALPELLLQEENV